MTKLQDAASPPSELFYEFSIGDIDFVALTDGFVESPAARAAPEIAEDEVRALLLASGHDPVTRRAPISCLYVRREGSDDIMIDAGLGQTPGPTGMPVPTAGRLPAALAAAGIDPGSVKIVLVSHMHPDHVGGLFTDDGEPLFPKARYHVSHEEVEFWSGAGAGLTGTLMPPPMQIDTVRIARRFLELAANRLTLFSAGDDVLDGIGTMLLPGHTPGQVGFLFRNDEQSLFYTADAAPHPVVSLQRPDWRFPFDSDSDLAVATRKLLIAKLFAENWCSFTPHFPWPSAGHLEQTDIGPVFVPLSATLSLIAERVAVEIELTAPMTKE